MNPSMTKQIMKINETLLDEGYTWADVERFWGDCIKEAKDQFKDSDINMFIPSSRAKRVSKIIEARFGLNLVPAIKRRYLHNDEIKFEMMDKDRNRFYFHDLVVDFLEKNVEIEQTDNHFKVAYF